MSSFSAEVPRVVRKYFGGELNYPVEEWLNKGLMAVWSPTLAVRSLVVSCARSAAAITSAICSCASGHRPPPGGGRRCEFRACERDAPARSGDNSTPI
eukprot:2033149-Pyramimonas_sp.AAC.2